MKNLYLLFAIILGTLLNAQTIQEPDLSIPLLVYDDDPNSYHYTLYLGLDSTATDSIDLHLGEVGYVIWPPPGVFDARFNLAIVGYNVSSWKDYRNANSFPYSGIKEHRLVWQWGFNATGLTIGYNFPEGIYATIKDVFTGGNLFFAELTDSNTYTIPLIFNSALLTMYYDNVVPVELISFTAFTQNNSVNLNWQTATETNNSGFHIERRKTTNERSDEWNVVGFVSGNGTTTEPHSYSFVDENLSSGIYKYRLKQIDFNGSYEYSNEIEVIVDLTQKEFLLHQNYPNPFNPVTSIQYAIGSKQFVQLKVYDVLGNEIATLVNEEKPAGSYVVEFNVAQDSRPAIASGIYFYKLQAGEFVQSKKMLLLK